MFKVFLKKNECAEGEEQTFSAGMGINGDDLLNMLPLEVQEFVHDAVKEDDEMWKTFGQNALVYMIAQKVVDITDITDEEKKKELAEVSESNFFD